MRKIFPLLAALALMCSCENDDTDFSTYTNASGGGNTGSVSVISIIYNGTSVSVTGDTKGYVSTSGADVTVDSGSDTDSLLLVVSGETSDGSLLVYRQRRFGLRLNGASITNADGPAINNQCGKALYLEVAAGTTNTLTDGTVYADVTDGSGNLIDQKGALFSEGQVFLGGTGTLTVRGNCKHGFACDDYIIVDDDLTLNISSRTGNGIKVNDGLWINRGTIGISVTADGARGIRCDSTVTISGGATTIATSGDCLYDAVARDYSSSACIKCDHQFTMTGGTLSLTSSGDGGKGINCSADVVFSGGTLVAKTTGDNDNGKPKAVKSDTGIIVSGGSFTATVEKSWACDNGYEDASLSDAQLALKRITVEGSPSTASIEKKSVIIKY